MLRPLIPVAPAALLDEDEPRSDEEEDSEEEGSEEEGSEEEGEGDTSILQQAHGKGVSNTFFDVSASTTTLPQTTTAGVSALRKR